MRKSVMTTGILLLFAAGTMAQESITVKGSDTMVLLGQRWAEEYMKVHKDVTIQVTGGGSGTGISAIINGTTDIANASRAMKRSERAKLKQRFGSAGVEIKAAKDGLAVYVHADNPVEVLTLEQLRRIYVGDIRNWKEVGGKDANILLYGRENNSGTYVYFKESVLKNADYAPETQSLPGTAAVVNAVTKDQNGIGYGGAAYGSGIKTVALKVSDDSPAYNPSLEDITSGTYPVTRFLYMYVKNRPTGEMKKYIDWILSDEGQKIVSEVGYFPVR